MRPGLSSYQTITDKGGESEVPVRYGTGYQSFALVRRQGLSRLSMKGKGGESGIRTHGSHKGYNGFRDRPIQPLWHLSGCALHYT